MPTLPENVPNQDELVRRAEEQPYSTPGPQLTDEQDPDLEDDVVDDVVDPDEQLAERARMKARFRLGAAVSTTSLVEMAKQAREEAKASRRSLDESTLPEGRFADREQLQPPAAAEPGAGAGGRAGALPA